MWPEGNTFCKHKQTFTGIECGGRHWGEHWQEPRMLSSKQSPTGPGSHSTVDRRNDD